MWDSFLCFGPKSWRRDVCSNERTSHHQSSNWIYECSEFLFEFSNQENSNSLRFQGSRVWTVLRAWKFYWVKSASNTPSRVFVLFELCFLHLLCFKLDSFQFPFLALSSQTLIYASISWGLWHLLQKFQKIPRCIGECYLARYVVLIVTVRKAA